MFTLGIYISTIRPELWEDLFSNLAATNVSFEIVLVGPIEKEKCISLPENVRLLYSDDCPAKCYHTGAMACNSKYIMNLADDCRFSDDMSLDRLIENIETRPSNSIVSPRYSDHQLFLKDQGRNLEWNPVMPVGSLMHKSWYIELKGIDKRFNCLFWDADIAMRGYEAGGMVFVEESVWIKEAIRPLLTREPRTKRDKELLNSMWINFSRGKKRSIRNRRKASVVPYSDLE